MHIVKKFRPFIKLWWSLLLCVILIMTAGSIIIYKTARDKDLQLRANLLSKAHIVSSGISDETIRAIADDSFLKNRDLFMKQKEIFTRIGNSQPDIRYICISVLRDDKIVFYLDSEPDRYANSKKPLAVQGEVYEDAPRGWKEVIISGFPTTIGPYTDKWGTFVSGVVAIRDKESKKNIGVLNLDLLAGEWEAEVYESVVEPFSITLLTVILLTAFFINRYRNMLYTARALRRLKYQQTTLELSKTDNTDLAPALKRILTATAENLLADRVSFWRYDDDYTAITCEQLYNARDGSFESGATHLAADFPVYFKALEEGRSIAANDARTDPRTFEFTEKHFLDKNIFSMMDTLIWLHGKIAGVLCVEQQKNYRNWEPEDIDFAVTITELISLVMETAERKQAQAELKESRDYLEKIINSVGDLMFVKDELHRYILVNDSLCEFLGRSRDEIIFRPDAAIFPGEAASMKLSGDNVVLESGHAYIGEERIPGAGGNVRVFLVKKTLYRDNTGKKYIVGVARDITDRKKMEEESLRTSKLESLGILAGGIAHDFNNVLMGIIGNISLAKKRIKDDEKTREILARAEGVSHKAKNLTEQLITFSRGGVPIKKLCSINEIITLSAQFALTGSNVILEFDLFKGLWSVEADEGQITQVITNIVINSKQAVADQGRVKIKTENFEAETDMASGLAAGKYVAVTISDNGSGIAPENIAKIFDPYYTTKTSGTGLGLSTTYSIIKNHGGAISVDSTPGSGTAMRIYLPAVSGQIITGVADETVTAVNSRCGILIMDDDEDVLIPLRDVLSDSGYSVKIARDGDEAIKIYRRQMENGPAFDLVIMDIVIRGGMGGREAVEKLIAIDPKARVIVSSGYSNDPIMGDYQKYGFCGVLAKPYKIEDVEKIINGYLTGKVETNG
ncbi:MAG TPA: ATP-binding protein [Candidatus Wallbacteria bacterium]|nr:ATP-binding protein [Candidatus Wallbacteria bacterium]